MPLIETEQPKSPIYGRLDKYTSVKELAAKRFLVPPVFETMDAADEWKQKGGTVIARPYFDAPWDSAIFLPHLQSYFTRPGSIGSNVRIYERLWNEAIQKLWATQNLQGYLNQFGIPLSSPPAISYFLQAGVTSGVEYNSPVCSTMVLMENDDLTHMEWSTSGLPGRSGIYKNGQHHMLDSFNGFHIQPYLSDENVYNQYLDVITSFPDKNIQVEFAYGSLLPGEQAQLYVVQARDFPQMRDRLWEYGKDYNSQFDTFGLSNQLHPDKKIQEFFGSRTFVPIEYASQVTGRPYVLQVNEFGWRDDELIQNFNNIKGLWIQGKWSKLPLTHGVFSLIELAHLKGARVLLG